MTTIIIRPADAGDVQAVHDCWLATDYPEPVEYAQMAALGMAPWFPHLFATGNLWVAEVDGRVVGFAGTQTRGRVCYLADCFVHPEWQSKGITRALLAQLHDDTTLVHCTLASSDPRAASRYIRAGMTPRYPMYVLESNARTRRMPLQCDTGICTDIEEWLFYDQRLVGHDRRVDIMHLCDGTNAVLLQMRDDNRLLGQAVVHERRYDRAPQGKRNIGPVGAFARAHAAAVAQSAVAWALADGATWVTLRIPGPHPGLPVLLDMGMNIVYVETFCASQEWFNPECYAPSGIM